jgi:hypothetical protein
MVRQFLGSALVDGRYSECAQFLPQTMSDLCCHLIAALQWPLQYRAHHHSSVPSSSRCGEGWYVSERRFLGFRKARLVSTEIRQWVA